MRTGTTGTFLLAALFLAGLASCGGGRTGGSGPPEVPEPPSFDEGFEAGLALWTKDADVPPSPEDPGVPVAWSIEASTEQALEGATSARYVLDGRQDDGVVWLERAVAATPFATYDVTVSAAWWSASESFNTTAMVALHAGASSPEVEADFEQPFPLNEVAGWKRYGWTFRVTAGADGAVHVAVGVSVVWETWITYYVDAVSVRLVPR